MTNWTVDREHSSIGFEVKHMMVSKVKGLFQEFTAKVEADDLTDLTTANIQFTILVDSIYTKSTDRENHLKSADFFNVEQFPHILFTSTNIEKQGEHFHLTGDLTIRDVTKPVTFLVEFGGKGKNPWGVEVYGFEANTKIDREEFGLTWNQALETGGVLVGKEIKIHVELEVNPAS